MSLILVKRFGTNANDAALAGTCIVGREQRTFSLLREALLLRLFAGRCVGYAQGETPGWFSSGRKAEQRVRRGRPCFFHRVVVRSKKGNLREDFLSQPGGEESTTLTIEAVVHSIATGPGSIIGYGWRYGKGRKEAL